MFASARRSRPSAGASELQQDAKKPWKQGAGSEVRSESAAHGSSANAGPGLDSNSEAFCRVVARVRPKRAFEANELQGAEVLPERSSVLLSDGREQTAFVMDEVIDSTDGKGTQAEIFERVGRDILAQATSGFNVFVIAYGPTGSGKTFTILGSSSSELGGLLPRSLKELFLQHSQDAKPKSYSCEFFEVYNDQIRDLLAPGKERLRKVHMHPKHGVRVEGLTSAPARTPEEALSLLNLGNQMRAVSATTMNDHFARSHAFFTLKFDLGVQDAKRSYRTCETSLTFVDLAGSEDLVSSSDQVSRDMCHMDSSLAELSQLVAKLADGQRPSGSSLRKSKLNMLLSQALLGNCKTTLIATVAPTRSSYHESWSTMSFASGLRKIKTKVAPSKVSQPLAQELEAEVRKLRREIAEAKTSSEREAELAASQAWLSYYKEPLEDVMSKMKDDAKLRRRAALKLGLAEAEAHPRTESGQPAPFLTKLTDDAVLHGCCNHFLRKSATAVGSDSTCDVVLSGIGMRPSMCEFRLQSQPDLSQRVTAQLSSNSAKPSRVIINGEPLKPRTIRALSHGDSILLGYAHAFRLVLPSEATLEAAQADAAGGPTDATTLARSSLANLDLTSALCEVREDGQQFQEALAYAHKLSGKVPEQLLQAFVRSLHVLCPLVDEANIITAEVFGESNQVSLKLQALMSQTLESLPELVISVTQSQVFPTSSLLEGLCRRALPQARLVPSETSVNGSEGRSVKYFWSLDKFFCRLREMRDVYQEGLEAKDDFLSVRRRLETRRYASPWHELNHGDIQSILPDLGSKRMPGPASGKLQVTVPAVPPGNTSRASDPEAAPASPRTSPRGQAEAETGQVTSAISTLRARSPTPGNSMLTRLGALQLHGEAATVAAAATAAVHAAVAALPSERGTAPLMPAAVVSDGSGSGSAQIGPRRSSRPESPDGLPPGVSRRDLDDMTKELSTCRQETGRLFTEQGRLAGLLDRFESLLGTLSHPAAGLFSKGQSSPRAPSPRALAGQASQTPIASRQTSTGPTARNHQVAYLGTSSASMHVPPSGSNSPLTRPRRLLTPPAVRSAGNASATVSAGSTSYFPESEVGPCNLHPGFETVTVLTETSKEATAITPREAPRRSAKESLQSPLRGSGETSQKSPRAASPTSGMRVTPHRLPLQTVTTAPLVTLQAPPEPVRTLSPRGVPIQNSSSVPAITAQQQTQLLQLMTKYQVQAAKASSQSQKQAATQQTFNVEPVTAGALLASPPHLQPQVLQPLQPQQSAVLRQLSPGKDAQHQPTSQSRNSWSPSQTLRSPRLSQTLPSQTLQYAPGGSLRVVPPQQPPAQAATAGRLGMLGSPAPPVPLDAVRLNVAQVSSVGNSLSVTSAGGSSSVPPADVNSEDLQRRGSSLKVAI